MDFISGFPFPSKILVFLAFFLNISVLKYFVEIKLEKNILIALNCFFLAYFMVFFKINNLAVDDGIKVCKGW